MMILVPHRRLFPSRAERRKTSVAQTLHQSLTDLNQIHRQLEELFYQHQAAALNKDLALAVELLGKFERCLFYHMREEDEILMPLYRERAPSIHGGDPEIFTAEHKKITEWLNRLKVRLQRLSHPAPDLKALIALLDDEAQFKKYMEHHTLREDRVFYPEIDRLVGDKDRPALLRLLTFSLEEMTDTF
jgi:iron-sulfur cluster repair protein YtfE (RIC family)